MTWTNIVSPSIDVRIPCGRSAASRCYDCSVPASMPRRVPHPEGRPEGATAPIDRAKRTLRRGRSLQEPRQRVPAETRGGEAGGRVGVCPGLYDDPQPSEP